jgi:hypothetical protein
MHTWFYLLCRIQDVHVNVHVYVSMCMSMPVARCERSSIEELVNVSAGIDVWLHVGLSIRRMCVCVCVHVQYQLSLIRCTSTHTHSVDT